MRLLSRRRSRFFRNVQAVVFDFDGVLTDNRVTVGEDGRESVRCNRSDGIGVSMLRAMGVRTAIVSSEQNPVVQVRAAKMGIECHQAKGEKSQIFASLLKSWEMAPDSVAFVGNDINDLGCLSIAGVAVCVADAYEPVRRRCRVVLKTRGGEGVVREVHDLIVESRTRRGRAV